MSNYFVTVRFDRMKNLNTKALYVDLLDCINYLENDIPEIINANIRLQSYYHLTKIFVIKPRKELYTAEIRKLRTHNDKLIRSIQFQYRALAFAAFVEDRNSMEVLKSYFVKLFKNYNRGSIVVKKAILYNLNLYINRDNAFQQALIDQGFMRFVLKLNENTECIENYKNEQKLSKQNFPPPNTIQPNKEKLLTEMRLYMRTIELYFQTHPQVLEKEFVNHSNIVLKEARTLLRSTTTRRIRTKAKAENKLAAELSSNIA